MISPLAIPDRSSSSSAVWSVLAGAHPGLEHGVAGLARRLRPVHGEIRVAQHLVGLHRGAVARVERDADARRLRDRPALHLDRLGHRVDDPVCDRPDLPLADPLAEQRELVPAQARQRVAGPEQPLEPAGDLDQDLIARGMTERVVDQLEGVEVEVDDRVAGRAAPARGHPDAIGEQRPVRQPGERVVQRLAREALLRLLAVGDVLDLAEQVADRPVAVVDRRDVQRDPDRVSLRVHVALLGPVAVALAIDQVAEGVEIGVDVVGVGDLAEGLAEQLMLRVAGELAEGAVDPLVATAGRDEGHPHVAVVEGLAEELLGLAEVPAGPPQRQDQRMNGGPDRPGEHDGDDDPLELFAVVATAARGDERGQQGERHRGDRDRELAAGAVDREPGDRNRQQRVEDRRRGAARVPEQAEDDEVGEREDRLRPGRVALPGHEQGAGDDDRDHGRGDRNPRVGERESRHGDAARRGGRPPRRTARCARPRSLPRRSDPARRRGRSRGTSHGRPDVPQRLVGGSLSTSSLEVPLRAPIRKRRLFFPWEPSDRRTRPGRGERPLFGTEPTLDVCSRETPCPRPGRSAPRRGWSCR